MGRVQELNRDTLAHYARFIGDTVDDVVNQLSDRTLRKDRGFLVARQQPAVSRRCDGIRLLLALRLRASGCSTRGERPPSGPRQHRRRWGKDPRNKGGRSPLTRDPARDPRRG